MKVAIIFGVTGQDGSYLSELLLDKGYAVIGVCRRASVDTTMRLVKALTYHDFHLVEGDVTDETSVSGIVEKYSEADEIYNLAAQSHVQTSFEQPHYTWKCDAIGVMNILEAIRRYNPCARFYQASTSEMFGNNFSTLSVPTVLGDIRPEIKMQDEETAFEPTSPYAIAKLAGHHLVRMYRDAYDIYACSGILFNHESERRGDSFVTRKITRYVGWLHYMLDEPKVAFSTKNMLHLGNLSASRDWGHAEDYVRAMWLMLQEKEPGDYVIATGKSHSVEEFCEQAFKYVDVTDWRKFVHVNEKFIRPSDVEYLCGDSTKAQEKLGWEPQIGFEELVERMVLSDIQVMEGKPCPTML